MLTSPNQSARENQSTADIIWTYQYQTAFAQRYNQVIYFLGIDLTKAFDTVDRQLTVRHSHSYYSTIFTCDAALSLKVKLGKAISEPFSTTHGINNPLCCMHGRTIKTDTQGYVSTIQSTKNNTF